MVGRGIVKVKNRIRMRYELGEIGCNDDNSIRGESKSGDERKCREMKGEDMNRFLSLKVFFVVSVG